MDFGEILVLNKKRKFKDQPKESGLVNIRNEKPNSVQATQVIRNDTPSTNITLEKSEISSSIPIEIDEKKSIKSQEKYQHEKK